MVLSKGINSKKELDRIKTGIAILLMELYNKEYPYMSRGQCVKIVNYRFKEAGRTILNNNEYEKLFYMLKFNELFIMKKNDTITISKTGREGAEFIMKEYMARIVLSN